MESAPLPPQSPIEDRAAHDERFAALYAELHRIARREAHRYGERGALGTTTLLHDAYLQIAQRNGLAFDAPAPFLAYAARAMRGLVIDRVRARGALRRGGDLTITSLDTDTAESIDDPQVLEEISEALDELAALDPMLARLVDLKFFCGCTMAEIAAQEHVSLRTAERQWEKARALLYRVLKAG